MSWTARKIHRGLAIVAWITLAGCATLPPPTADLAGARALVERARAGLDAGAGAAEIEFKPFEALRPVHIFDLIFHLRDLATHCLDHILYLGWVSYIAYITLAV